jgi:hypothetical protein
VKSRLELEFDQRPSVLAYHLRALYPGLLRRPPPFPRLRARWKASRADPARLERFLEATGLGTEGGLPALYPQVITFPLQMVILTHRSFPLPIWKVLQIRNSLLLHRAIPVDAALDAEAAVVGQRVLEKGIELDLHVGVRSGEALVWEGLTTYFYRGRFGQAEPGAPLLTAPALAGSEVARWRTDPGGGLRFSGLSGDYNGIHFWSAYARRFGFQGAIHHPHQLIGQCLARLPEPAWSRQRLDLWLKGPVYYGDEVGLAAREGQAGVDFTLTVAGSGRPALLARRSEVEPGSRLLDPLVR